MCLSPQATPPRGKSTRWSPPHQEKNAAALLSLFLSQKGAHFSLLPSLHVVTLGQEGKLLFREPLRLMCKLRSLQSLPEVELHCYWWRQGIIMHSNLCMMTLLHLGGHTCKKALWSLPSHRLRSSFSFKDTFFNIPLILSLSPLNIFPSPPQLKAKMDFNKGIIEPWPFLLERLRPLPFLRPYFFFFI